MANRKISELGALTAPAADDLLAVVDVSEGANANKNKKITYGELFKSVIDGTETAPAIAFDTAGTTGLYKSAANELSIATNGGKALTIEANNKTTIFGDLVVTGGTTTVSSTTITVADKNIELATGNTSDTGATGGGLTIKAATDKTWNWIDSTDSWTSNQNIDLVSGMSYKIQANQVLTATTLGAGVVNSSLTSVGTLGTLAVTGEIDAGSLDVSGDADIDGTLEADAYTVNGVALNEFIADTVGAMVSTNTETNITVTYEDSDNTLDFVIGTLNQDTTGNAATATALQTARNIGGVSFNGTADINLPGVNQTGNQNTTGSAATLTTARTIGGVSFDGSANINLPGVNAAGNQNTSGTAAVATTITVADESTDNSCNILYTTGPTGNLAPKSGTNLTFNSASGLVTATSFAGALTGNVTGDVTGNVTGNVTGDLTGNADTATALETARTIGGVSFNGTSNINLPGVNAVGNQNTTGSAATLTTARTIGGVSFNGSANINLPGVNAVGNQNTTGSAATLTTARTIGGVSFNGSANIDLPGVNTAGNQNTSGNAATATALATARTIGGTSFDGTANITPANATNAVNLSGTIASGVTGTTQSTSDNSTKIATTAYVTTAVANLIDSAPGALDTLNELAAAIGDDANFSTTITNSLATKLPLAGGTMTGAINLGSNNITNGGTITGTFVGNITGNVTGNTSGSSGSCTGNAATATALATARTIGGVSFDGTSNINLPGVNAVGNQNTTGSAATLTTARTIGGVSFNGSANINLPGVNAAGNQNTSGNAATATALATARAINGVNFDGTAAITVTAAAGTLTGNTLASGVTASSLTSVGTLTGLTVSGDILMTGTGAIDVPSGTTAQRPGSPTTGHFRYNTTDAQFEGFTATGWGAIAGGGGGASNFTYLSLRNAANNGSAVFDGSQNEFTLVSSGTSTAISPSAANVLLTSLGGVIQQPNEGTSTSGITGFCIDGSTIKFGANLTMAPDFIIHQVGAGIGTPSDNTVNLDHLVHKAQGDILFYGASGAPSVLNAGTSGKFLRTNGSSANPTWETIDLTNLSASNLTSGTIPAARIGDDSIVNAKINSSAAIAGTKISPNFGSQNVVTTGTLGSNNLTITSAAPALLFTETNGDPDYKIQSNAGVLKIVDNTNSADRLVVNTNGHIDVTGNLDVGAGVDVTGNITVTGTVDGVDIAARNTLFGGLTSSSGVLTNGVTATTQSASDNSTKVATTAYTDTAISNLVDSSPSALNTLNELAAALGDDANFSTTITNSIATKLPLAGGTLTGDLTVNAEIGANKLTLWDNGASSPVLVVKADDNSPWAFCVKNDTYSTNTGHGLLGFQNNNGDNIIRTIGNSEYLNFTFQQTDGTTTRDCLKLNSGGAAELFYQNNLRLATTTNGVEIHSSGNEGLIISGSNDPYILFKEGSTNKAWVQWKSNGYLELANSEDSSRLRIRDDMDFTPDGTNYYTVWHSNNDGAGSALDAGKVSGHTVDWHNIYNLRAHSTGSGAAGMLGVDSNGSFMYQVYGSGGTQYGFLAGAWGTWDIHKTVGGNMYLNNQTTNRVISQNDNPTFGDIYSSSWFRNNDSTEGFYNQSTTQHFYSDGDDTWNVGGGTSANAIRFRDEHGGTVRGWVYANSSNQIGFLSNDGNWKLYVNGSTDIRCVNHFYPAVTNTYDLGSGNLRWNNLYVNDMHFSNEGKEGGNDVDGTTGDWTLQEGADTIFMINNKTGKKYKMALQEVS